MMNTDQQMGLPLLLPEEQNLTTDPTGPTQFPNPSTVLQNIVKQKALDTVGRKIGLPALGQVLGMNALYSNPFGMALLGPVGAGIGALFGGIKQKFSNFKTQKQMQNEAIKRDIARDMQQQNRQDNTGGYQAGYDSGFMEGKGTASEMGSS